MWTALGAIAFFVAFKIDYRRWQQWAVPLTVVATALCAVVLLPNVGIMVGGSRRWLGMGWMRFQPSELAKLAVLLFAADLLTRRHDEIGDWRAVLRPVLMVFGTLAALVYIEPDLDSTVVLGLITVSVLIAGGVRLRHLGALAGVGVAAVAVMAIAEPYRRARVFTFLHPTADASNAGYQIVQSLIALGSGGVTGVGLGAGSAKWHFLPNAHTDFVFSIIGEELGLVGCLLVLSLFVGFAVFGVGHRAAGRRPVRDAARRRHHGVGHGPGRDQHRRGHRPPARLGHPAAVRVVRWIVARGDDARHRHPGQRRPDRRAHAVSMPAPTQPGERRGVGSRVRRRHRRRHRRPRVPGPRGGRRAGATGPRPRHRPLPRLGPRARGHARCRRPASRSTCSPAAASVAACAPDAIAQNLRTAWDTVVACARAVGLLRRRRPAVVFGVGGYAAAPGRRWRRGSCGSRWSSTSRTPRRGW